MALGNWTGWSVTFSDLPGNVTHVVSEGGLTRAETKEGLSVESYKNWLYLGQPETKTSSYQGGTIGEVWSGAVQVQDLCVLARRGPNEGIYFLCWDRSKSVVMIGLSCRNRYNSGMPCPIEYSFLFGTLWRWLYQEDDFWSLDWELPTEEINRALDLVKEKL